MEFHSRLLSVFLSPAPTTVNVTHRPVTQSAARLPIPRAPANHQVVYTTIPAQPPQNPVRGAVMPSPNLRPVNPQTGGRGFYILYTFHCSTAKLDTFCLMDMDLFIFFFTILVQIIEMVLSIFFFFN